MHTGRLLYIKELEGPVDIPWKLNATGIGCLTSCSAIILTLYNIHAHTYAHILSHSLHLLQVISRKLSMDVAVFADLGPGVYFMHHKTKEQAKWVGLSPDLSRTLCGLFFQLYQKKRSELSPLEVELKFFSPLAADWDIQVWPADPNELVLEKAKKIVELKTLKPFGLNALKFTNMEMWEEFAGWFGIRGDVTAL